MVQSPNSSVAWKASVGIGACLLIGTSLYLLWQNRMNIKPANDDGDQKKKKKYSTGSSSSTAAAAAGDKRIPVGGVVCDNYEVFLSFRGEDTRKGFTSHLYQALDDHGIRTFLDNEKLERGQSLKPQLDGAIKKSEVVIVVISESHATSRWCLNELLAIVQCNKPVIPIFYHVHPSDFRNQTGPFAEPFAKYEKKLGREKVKEWKDAMNTIANHSGYDLDHTADGNEAKLIKMIVRDVTKRVDKGKAHVGTNLPGMDSRKQDVLRMLDAGEEDVRMLGIWGTGGLGKTTLAKTIYNELIGDFEFKCFVENVREKATQENGLISLQKYLISEISREKCDDMMSSGQAMEKVQRSLRNKRVLLVVDDADAVEQLDALVVREFDDLFGAGSRIVITTRIKDLLVGCNIDNDMIYEPLPLNLDQSRLLFCHHAFKNDAPAKGYEKLTDDMVSKLGGHPLALKVTGAYMFGKRSEEIWRQMSKKLEGGSHDEKVDKCLRISFDGLGVDDGKEIFLDICCFFIGKDVQEALYMWEAGDFKHFILAIDELQSKSLLQIDGQSCKFQMHDVVRDMGRKIVYSKSKQTRGCSSRIWNQDEALNLLENYKVSSEAEGILVNYDRRKKVSLDTKCFKESSNLRLLSCGGADIEGSFESFPSKLNLLDWSRCNLQYLPDDMSLRECAVLRLARSNFIQLSMESKVFLPKLRVLDLQRCEKLESLPHDLSTTIPHLKRLIVRGCWNLSGLPDSLCGLMELEVLDLHRCDSVERLPEDLGDLKSLKVFILDGTRVLDLPTSMGELSKLMLFHWCPFREDIEVIGSKGEEELERLINIVIHGLKQLTHLKLPPIEQFVLKVLTGSSQLLSQLRHLEFVHNLVINDSPINYSSLVEEKKELGGYYNTEILVVPQSVGHGGIVAPVLEFLRIAMPSDGPLTKLDTLPSMPSLVELRITRWVNCKCLWKVIERKELIEGTSTTTSPVPCLKKLLLDTLSDLQTLPYLPSFRGIEDNSM